jgi:transcriptional regulator with XRE-family HTH domain
MTDRFYFKEWRKFAGLSQEEVARELGMKRQTLSRIESGQADCSISFVKGFADLVGCRHFTDPLTRPPDGRPDD